LHKVNQLSNFTRTSAQPAAVILPVLRSTTDPILQLIFLGGGRSSKKPNAPSIQIDQDEIWHDYSSDKYANYTSIDGVIFLYDIIISSYA